MNLQLLWQILGAAIMAGVVFGIIGLILWGLTTEQNKYELRVWWNQLTWRPKRKRK